MSSLQAGPARGAGGDWLGVRSHGDVPWPWGANLRWDKSR